MKGFLDSQEEDINYLEEKYPPKTRKKFEVFGWNRRERSEEIPERPPETPCQCKMAQGANSIFCDRHQCLKSQSLHNLCKTRMDYFQMWEDGEGPMQDALSRITAERSRENPIEGEVTNAKPLEKGFFETNGDKFFMGDPDIPSESRGLGDTVAKITKATGIKKVTDAVFGALNKDCGCKERQSKLNKLFPYGKKKKTKGFFE